MNGIRGQGISLNSLPYYRPGHIVKENTR
jgi:hypothetical protein